MGQYSIITPVLVCAIVKVPFFTSWTSPKRPCSVRLVAHDLLYVCVWVGVGGGVDLAGLLPELDRIKHQALIHTFFSLFSH